MRACSHTSYFIATSTVQLLRLLLLVIMNKLHATNSLNMNRISAIFPEAQHFVSNSKEHVRFEFSSSHPPIAMVDEGDLVHVETIDCFYGKIRPDTLFSWEEQKQKTRAQKLSGEGNGSNNSDHFQPKNNGNKNESRGGTYVNGSILDEIPRSQRNPVTGPIYVNGARPGDVLAVTLLDIRPKGIGVSCCGSWGGQLSCWMAEDSATLRFFDLSQCRSIVTMRDIESKEGNESGSENESKSKKRGFMLRSGSMPPRRKRIGPIAFPASPMLGVIGVAPSSNEEDPIGTIPAGKHGGNLDNTANGIGSTIYIPIHHPGGLLSMGDMHASQGDGEIAGSGVEIGGDVLLRCKILRHEDLYGTSFEESNHKNSAGEEGDDATPNGGFPWKLEYPVTETPTHWITHGVAVCDIPQTTSIACQEAAKILIGQWGFSPEEAFIFLGVRGDLGLCQACHPDKGTQIAKMSVPKLDRLCPRAFKVLMSSESKSESIEGNDTYS